MSPRLLPSFSTIPVIESPRVAGLSYCHIYPAVGVVDLGIPIYIYITIFQTCGVWDVFSDCRCLRSLRICPIRCIKHNRIWEPRSCVISSLGWYTCRAASRSVELHVAPQESMKQFDHLTASVLTPQKYRFGHRALSPSPSSPFWGPEKGPRAHRALWAQESLRRIGSAPWTA